MPAAGQPVTPVSPGRRGSGSGNQPPGGAAARAAGGGGGGAGPRGRRPAHPEVVVAAAARAMAGLDPGRAVCARLPRDERRAAAGGARLRPPRPASRDAGTPPDGAGGVRPPVGGGPGGLEVSSTRARDVNGCAPLFKAAPVLVVSILSTLMGLEAPLQTHKVQGTGGRPGPCSLCGRPI